MASHIIQRCIPLAKCAGSHDLTGNVIEHMACELDEGLFHVFIQRHRVSFHDGKDLVVDFSIFNLLHQADRLAEHDLSGAEGLPGEDKAVNVVAIFSRGVEDKSIGQWISTLELPGSF